MARDNLIQYGRQWYLRLAVPRSLRHRFESKKGKPRAHIVEPLGDSYEVAKVAAAQRVAACEALFARLKAGEPMTDEQIKAAMQPPAVDPWSNVRAWFGRSPGPLTPHEQETYAKALRESYHILIGAAGVAPEAAPAPSTGETVSRGAEAWLASMESQPLTIDGHRKRVQAFVKHSGDMPLTDVTRANAWDFLASLDVSQGTRNAYQTTLKCVFDSAKERGRFAGDNPFAGKKKKAKGDSYVPFTVAELQTLFDALPRDVAPRKHSPETALPWVAAIALYSGARLEEIAQLTVADVRAAGANGATVTVIDVHNGGTNKLKNETSARLIPVHSELVRLGLLRYVEAVKSGPLFPGLKRRESKGGKVGARLGELFRKKLVALGLKRDGLCFHSFRHTVAGRLDAAEVRQSDAARVLGHAVEGMSFGTYSQEGPGLKQVAAVVDKIDYPGLRL
jgi:integrase